VEPLAPHVGRDGAEVQHHAALAGPHDHEGPDTTTKTITASTTNLIRPSFRGMLPPPGRFFQALSLRLAERLLVRLNISEKSGPGMGVSLPRRSGSVRAVASPCPETVP